MKEKKKRLTGPQSLVPRKDPDEHATGLGP
jgi:hypothetical protein